MRQPGSLGIAVLIPCLNEENTIATVIADFCTALPDAKIFVYDNNSIDRTVEVAKAAGAIVRSEPLRGKGNVVRRMFADIDADVYVLVDGDATYHAPSAPLLVQGLIEQHADMVNGARQTPEKEAYRTGHRFGNVLLSSLVRMIFSDRINDMLSGYRVFSRRYVKSFPALSQGFEIETEMTVHALELRMPILEIDTPYGGRPEGSVSKLNTYRDGVRIIHTIIRLVKEERPLQFFSTLAFIFFIIGSLLGLSVTIEFAETGLVARFPTAILASGLGILGLISLTAGLILDTVTRGRREMKRLFYLSFPSLPMHRNGDQPE